MLSADSNLQALHQYADGSDFSISESSDELISKLQTLRDDFGPPTSECLEEMDVPKRPWLSFIKCDGEDVAVDSVTMMNVLPTCAELQDLKQVWKLRNCMPNV